MKADFILVTTLENINKIEKYMFKKAFFFVSFVLLSCYALGQKVKEEKWEDSVIYLKEFSSRKVLAYTISYVTVFMSFEDGKNDIKRAWQFFWSGVTPEEKQKIISERDSSDRNNRILFIDSIYEYLSFAIKNQDTVYLSQTTFDNAEFRCLIAIDQLIEKGECAIVDNRNKRHYKIIRKKGYWYKGQLNAWGGRRYFLPKKKKWFYAAMDWIS
ncbi:MAG: hypothetical protein KDB99_15955 [Chitinophagaceae bacterium]|nr:hypothetical protein [Chitinophagaceae bacterium]